MILIKINLWWQFFQKMCMAFMRLLKMHGQQKINVEIFFKNVRVNRAFQNIKKLLKEYGLKMYHSQDISL